MQIWHFLVFVVATDTVMQGMLISVKITQTTVKTKKAVNCENYFVKNTAKLYNDTLVWTEWSYWSDFSESSDWVADFMKYLPKQ